VGQKIQQEICKIKDLLEQYCICVFLRERAG